MERRKFLGAVAAGATLSVAGCGSDATEESDSGVEGGPHLNYERSVNSIEGGMVVDLSLRAWFNCSHASPDGEHTFTIQVIAAGEVVASKEWTINFEDCMKEHTTYMSFKLDEQYDSILIRAE